MDFIRLRGNSYPETPKWIFPWKPLGIPGVVKAISLLVPCGLFALAFTSLRINVDSPEPWVPQSVSVIQAMQDTGRELRLLAQENGPFPTRLDVKTIPEMKGKEKEVDAILRGGPKAYQPTLRSLPETDVFPRSPLAEAGEMALPPLPPTQLPTNMPAVVTAPLLVPLAGLKAEEIPQELPPFDIPVDDAMTGETWRFLVRLRPDGSVIDAVSLSGGDDDRSDRSLRLMNWLRSVRFSPAEMSGERFAGIGLRFLNHPIHGSESR